MKWIQMYNRFKIFCSLKIIADFLVLHYNCLFAVPPIITWGQQGRNKISASFIFCPDKKLLFKHFSVTINPTKDLFGPTLIATSKQFAGVSWTLASVLVNKIRSLEICFNHVRGLVACEILSIKPLGRDFAPCKTCVKNVYKTDSSFWLLPRSHTHKRTFPPAIPKYEDIASEDIEWTLCQ